MKLTEYLQSLYQGNEIELTASLGYVITTNCIRRCLRVSQEEKMALFEIYSHYNDDLGYAFPTQQTLAMYLGVTSPTVSKHLNKLEQKKFIASRGRNRKRYIPSFELHKNPYIFLSENFHFATKVINKHLLEGIGGNWGDNLLRYVNVHKNDEFTDKDFYGHYLKELTETNFLDNVVYSFQRELTKFVESLTGEQLTIDWDKEIEEHRERQKNRQKEWGKGRRKRISSLPTDDDEWKRTLKELG